MKKFFFILLIIIFFLQFSTLPFFTFQSINLLFLFSITLAIIYPFEENIGWSLAAGLLLDLFSTAGFGVYTISLITIVFVMDGIRKNFLPERKNLLVIIVVLLLCSLAFVILSFLVDWVFAYYRLSPVRLQWGGHGIGYFFSKVLLEAGAGVLIFFIVDGIERLFGRGRMDLKIINS